MLFGIISGQVVILEEVVIADRIEYLVGGGKRVGWFLVGFTYVFALFYY